jgi:hypothetical protein
VGGFHRGSTSLTIDSYIHLDLGNIAQSIQAGEEFLRKETRLDMLVRKVDHQFCLGD